MGVGGVAERTTYLQLYTWEDGPDLYSHVQLDANWKAIDDLLLKKTWGTAGDQAQSIKFGGWGTVVTAATTIMQSSRIGTADTNDRYSITIGGSASWGDGTAAVDVNLYRSAAATLKSSGTIQAVSFLAQAGIITNRLVATVAGTALGISVTGDTVDRLAANAGGTLVWGPGNAAVDTNLYRSASATLKTDSNFTVAGTVTIGADTNLYRSAADTLKTDDSLVVAGASLSVSGSATITGATKHVGNVGFYNTTPVAQATGYTPSNVTTDRTFDANATSVDELADILGTLINDLKAYGLIG